MPDPKDTKPLVGTEEEKQAALDAAKAKADADAASAAETKPNDRGWDQLAEETSNRKKAVIEARKAKSERDKYKTRLDKFEAAEEERKKAEMGEIELANTERDEARKELATERERSTDLGLKSDAMGAGAIGKYADFVAGQLKTAMAANSELDKENFFKEFKESDPAFFASKGNGAPPPGSGQGGPANASSSKGVADLQAWKDQLARCRDANERFYIQKQIRILEAP